MSRCDVLPDSPRNGSAYARPLVLLSRRNTRGSRNGLSDTVAWNFLWHGIFSMKNNPWAASLLFHRPCLLAGSLPNGRAPGARHKKLLISYARKANAFRCQRQDFYSVPAGSLPDAGCCEIPVFQLTHHFIPILRTPLECPDVSANAMAASNQF